MNAKQQAEKILAELHFDFAAFQMEAFLRCVGRAKGREIALTPWNMPAELFGAWASDRDEAREYIFYRADVAELHQTHIQLHELAHFLCGHPTLKLTRQEIAEAAAGRAKLPFEQLAQLRSPHSADLETQAETLASLIGERAIRASGMEALLHDPAPEEKLADFLKKMGVQ